MNEWIKCSDQLPDDEIAVLVFVANADAAIQLAYHEADRWREYAYGFDLIESGEQEVTHWMHLPAAPEVRP